LGTKAGGFSAQWPRRRGARGAGRGARGAGRGAHGVCAAVGVYDGGLCGEAHGLGAARGDERGHPAAVLVVAVRELRAPIQARRGTETLLLKSVRPAAGPNLDDKDVVEPHREERERKLPAGTRAATRHAARAERAMRDAGVGEAPWSAEAQCARLQQEGKTRTPFAARGTGRTPRAAGGAVRTHRVVEGKVDSRVPRVEGAHGARAVVEEHVCVDLPKSPRLAFGRDQRRTAGERNVAVP